MPPHHEGNLQKLDVSLYKIHQNRYQNTSGHIIALHKKSKIESKEAWTIVTMRRIKGIVPHTRRVAISADPSHTNGYVNEFL